MKKYNSFLKVLLFAFTAFFFAGCVQDDRYNNPTVEGTNCADLTATLTLAQVKALYTGTTYVFPATSADIIEGYVSSNDESGNIYKTIYIQDKPENPTQGFVISVDDVSTYANYPQGSKVYIKLKGLALGTYGGLVQLGVKDDKTVGTNGVSRIPEKVLPAAMLRSCTAKVPIVPKVLTLAEMGTANDALLGVLVQINNAEFDSKVLCTTFAPEGTSVDKQLNDPTASFSTRVVRNSGFAAFANQRIPAGKGTFIGIMSKFNSSYQLYINRFADLADMKNFPRKDGIAADPCAFNPGDGTAKTVAAVKALYSGSLSQITGDFVLKAKVTANDETGNLFKYIYVEDETGGIRISINKTALYQDPRFKVGKEVIIKLKDLYIGDFAREIQLGALFGTSVGQIEEKDLYKTFFDSNKPATTVVPTEKKISDFTFDDVGKWVKIKNVQFKSSEIGNPYAVTFPSDRMLEDCAGNSIIVRTSNRAAFAGEEIADGKGDIYAVLSYFSNKFQLILAKQSDADFDEVRCDGGKPSQLLFSDRFEGTLETNWTIFNKAGTQVWSTSNQGSATNYYAVMNGQGADNEDWLVSKEISLNGFNKYTVSYLTDGNGSSQNPIQFLITDSYTGDPATTAWTTLTGKIDSGIGLTNFGFESSTRVPISNFANKKVRIAVKYVSNASGSATWEVDNVQVRGVY